MRFVLDLFPSTASDICGFLRPFYVGEFIYLD